MSNTMQQQCHKGHSIRAATSAPMETALHELNTNRDIFTVRWMERLGKRLRHSIWSSVVHLDMARSWYPNNEGWMDYSPHRQLPLQTWHSGGENRWLSWPGQHFGLRPLVWQGFCDKRWAFPLWPFGRGDGGSVIHFTSIKWRENTKSELYFSLSPSRWKKTTVSYRNCAEVWLGHCSISESLQVCGFRAAWQVTIPCRHCKPALCLRYSALNKRILGTNARGISMLGFTLNELCQEPQKPGVTVNSVWGNRWWGSELKLRCINSSVR